MGAEFRHRILATIVGAQVARGVGPGEGLAADFLLQGNQAVEQRLGPRRTARDVDVDRDEAVDALEHVITLLERTAGNRARAHRDAILRFGHLVPEPDDLRRHFLCHRAGHDQQIRLPRRRTVHLRAKARDVETRHRRGDHLDRTTREAEVQRPDRIGAPPVVEVLHFGEQNALAAEIFAFLVGDRRGGGGTGGGIGVGGRGVAHGVTSTRGVRAARPRPGPRRGAE